ncbi:MAG: hypothetical protein QM756_17185 [Polyangiaceae bacterium]
MGPVGREGDAGGVEAEPLGARVARVAPLPEALAGEANAAAFASVEASEASRPGAFAARPNLDDDDQRPKRATTSSS